MTFDIAGLAEGESIPVCFSEAVTVAAEYGLLDRNVMMTVKGKLKNSGDIFELDAYLSASLTLLCGKCLTGCDYLLETNVTEIYKKIPYSKGLSVNTNYEFLPFDGNMIDVTPASLANLLINIPMRILCKEDCRGLCHICGYNLNDGDCGCDNTYIDPRLEAFKNQALKKQFFGKD